MRELPSGGWIEVYGTGRDRYVKLDWWRHPTYQRRKVKLHGKHRVHIRARHELVALDYDEPDRAPLDAAFAELDGLGYAWIGWVSSLRGGYPHYHGLVAVESLERRLVAEHIIEERLGKAVLKPEGLSCPGFAGKVVEDGVNYYPSKECEVCGERGVQGECDACGHITWNETTRYDTSMRDWMWEHQDNQLEFLHSILTFLRAVPRWDAPSGWQDWTLQKLQDHRAAKPILSEPRVDVIEVDGRTYANTEVGRRSARALGWVDPAHTPPVVPAVAPTPSMIECAPASDDAALPATLIALLDKDVPAPEKQAYDAYEPDEAARNGWAIMCVARQVGISTERLWQERHRPGMKHFRSRRQLEREYARVDASSTKRGDRRLAWAIAAQQDDTLSVFEKRFILHIAIRKHLVFGYGPIADAIGCSKMLITYMMRDENVLKYVRKSGKIIKPGEGREAQTFEIVDPPESVDLPSTLHSGVYGGLCNKMSELRVARLRWWDVLPNGETVLDAVTRLGDVQELGKEQPLAVWKLRVEDQKRSLARHEAQERYYKQLEDKKAARASQRWRRQLEREIELHKNPRRVDDDIMHRFRRAA